MAPSRNAIEFVPDGAGTELVFTITFENRERREQALATGMTDGMGLSFDTLDGLLGLLGELGAA